MAWPLSADQWQQRAGWELQQPEGLALHNWQPQWQQQWQWQAATRQQQWQWQQQQQPPSGEQISANQEDEEEEVAAEGQRRRRHWQAVGGRPGPESRRALKLARGSRDQAACWSEMLTLLWPGSMAKTIPPKGEEWDWEALNQYAEDHGIELIFRLRGVRHKEAQEHWLKNTTWHQLEVSVAIEVTGFP